MGLQNYVTSVNVLALTAAKRPEKYKAIVGDGVKFLKKLQWDEEEGKNDKDDFYGGAGYDSKSRPDLSNTQFFVDALHDAGVPAMTLVEEGAHFRQSLSEPEERIQRPSLGRKDQRRQLHLFRGRRRADQDIRRSEERNLTGYGSMTYAGIKSMIYCGVAKDDRRYQAAYEWIQKNYTLDGNPGMPPDFAERGLYYYYHTLAKTLDVMGVDEFVDAAGKKHDWRAN